MIIGRTAGADIGRSSLSNRQQFGARAGGGSRDLTVGAGGVANLPDDPSFGAAGKTPRRKGHAHAVMVVPCAVWSLVLFKNDS